MPDTPKKNIMRAFKMTEISAVDMPAQEGARVLIMKRDPAAPPKNKNDMNKGWDDLVDLLTSEVDGHQHGISIYRDEDHRGNESGDINIRVAYSQSVGQENSHDHPIVRNTDGSFVLGTVAGHTHQIDTAALNEKLLSTMTKGGDPMPKTAEEIQASLDTANASLEKANKIIALSADERAHFEKLDDAGKDSFLAKSTDLRKSEIDLAKSQAADADPVVYKTLDGIEIRKSAGETLIALAKSDDKKTKEIAKLTVERDNQALEKRASTELPNLGGDVKDRAALLKAVDDIQDESTRTKVTALLKGADNSMSKLYEQIGVSGEPDLQKKGDAEDKLDDLAKTHAAKHDVPFAKAYKAVLETKEGKALYNQTLN